MMLTSPYAGVIVSLPILFVVAYSLKLLPKRLKEIFIVKNLVVAVAWSLIPIYVAAFIGFEPHLLMSSFIVSIFIFLRIFIGVVMFDIRDVAGDIAAGIQTIPVRLGVEKSLVIVRFGNIGSFILFISAAICGMLNSVVAISAAVIAFCMGFAYEWAVKQDKIDFRLFCDVVVDSEYVLLGLPALFHSLVKI